MPSTPPFHQLFETFGKLPVAHAESVNLKARESMRGRLKVGLEKAGQCILLKAPRAGYGKTHLLTRLQNELSGTHEFIPLHATSGSCIDALTVLDDTLRRLVRPLPAAGGLTVLDLVARRLFSSSLQPLVRSGEVPCQDREGALNALRIRPIETFDFHHPSAVTAHWARENFELLGPRLSLELAQRNSLSLREVSFWVNAMFRFSATAIDNPGRVRALVTTVFDDSSAEASANERLVALLGLMTSLMRVVLVADELEGFSSDEAAALRFASFIGALRQSTDRLDVIISINQDVWESAFLPCLSGGLADRLSEIVVELEPLDRAAKIAILESRSPDSGAKILDEMDSESVPTYARGLIRKAAEILEKGPNSEKNPTEGHGSVKKVPSFKQDIASPEAGPTGIVTPEVSQETGGVSPPTAMDTQQPFHSEQASQLPSWPAPEVSESKLGEIPEATAPSTPLQGDTFPQIAQTTSFPNPPVDAPASGIFAAPSENNPPEPEKLSGPLADPSSGFVAAPPHESAPITEGSGDYSSEKSTNRVDDLLKQFRERYGKS